jgi:23S rRNA pseudouridine1911/1915/1917 synthase
MNPEQIDGGDAGHSLERECLIPDGVRRERADKLLAELVPELSRTRWQRVFQDGLVWLDDRCLRQKDILRPGDLVQFQLPPPRVSELRPVELPLDIVWEEDSFLVLNKAPGVVVHPGAGTAEDTLVHALLHHCPPSYAAVGGRERPGIVHRLDKETSGLMVIAKTESAYQSLSNQFAERLVHKVYRALVEGSPDPSEGTIDRPIARHPVYRTRMRCAGHGREARSDYRVERVLEEVSLVAVRIYTGRTHQIRVHFQSIGHSLLGDPVYGFTPGPRLLMRLPGGVPRVMLHAAELAFHHPDTGEPIQFLSPLPDDFVRVMAALGGSSSTE